MALAFQLVEFTTGIVPCSDTAQAKANFKFGGKIREDEDGNRVIDVALKSFTLEAYVNGVPEDWEFGSETVRLEVTQAGHQSGLVTVSMNLRPRLQVLPNPAFQFRGIAEALVIADLV